MTTGEILRAAAVRLAQPNAWLQRALCRKDGQPIHDTTFPLSVGDSWCATGAIYCELGDHWPRLSITHEALRLVCEVVGADPVYFTGSEPSCHSYVVCWNNAPDRTQDEVVAALLAAADLWESRQAIETTPQPEYEYA